MVVEYNSSDYHVFHFVDVCVAADNVVVDVDVRGIEDYVWVSTQKIYTERVNALPGSNLQRFKIVTENF